MTTESKLVLPNNSSTLSNNSRLQSRPSIRGLSKSLSVRRITSIEEQHQNILQHGSRPSLSKRATAIPKATATSSSRPAITISSLKTTVTKKALSNSTTHEEIPATKPALYIRECQKRACTSHLKRMDAGAKTQRFAIGQKVIVPNLQQQSQGTVRFYGEIEFKKSSGPWVGIELDAEGAGKNDGSIQGVRYFSCAPNTGLFVSAARVVPYEEQQQKKAATHLSNQKPKTTKSTRIKPITGKKDVSTLSTIGTPLKRSSAASTTRMESACFSSAKPIKSSLTASKSTRLLSIKNNTSETKFLPTRSTPLAATIGKARLQPEKEANIAMKQTKTSKTNVAVASSNDNCKNHRHRSKSRPKSVDVEILNRLLERSNLEKQALTAQMDSQEAAWDQLVNVKESYAVRVKEKEDQIMHLQQKLDDAAQAMEELAIISEEKNDALDRAIALEIVEKQQNKAIQQLNERIDELKQQLEVQRADHRASVENSKAQIGQLRVQLIEREETIVDLERECAELRQTHMETVKSFEHSISQTCQQFEETLQKKNREIDQLQKMAAELKREHSCLPPTPTSSIAIDDAIPLISPQRRLEAQLELATHELDREHDINASLKLHIEELKAEIKRLNTLSISSNSQYYNLRSKLEQEVQDKQRIMNEANIAAQAQWRLEEETLTLKLTLQKTQQNLNEVLKKLASIEKQQQQKLPNLTLEQMNADKGTASLKGDEGGSCTYKSDAKVKNTSTERVDQLEKAEMDREIDNLKVGDCKLVDVKRQQCTSRELINEKQSEIDRLSKETSNLESLLENMILREAQLEEAVLAEKKKVQALEVQLHLQQAD